MTEASWEPADFEKQWIEVNEEVVKQLLAHPTIQEIKERVRTEGSISGDDRNAFIALVNEIKYKCIYDKFGSEGSESYEEFQKAWKHWEKLRAHDKKGENLYETNINHLLYGSTPNPEEFLQDFDINK